MTIILGAALGLILNFVLDFIIDTILGLVLTIMLAIATSILDPQVMSFTFESFLNIFPQIGGGIDVFGIIKALGWIILIVNTILGITKSMIAPFEGSKSRSPQQYLVGGITTATLMMLTFGVGNINGLIYYFGTLMDKFMSWILSGYTSAETGAVAISGAIGSVEQMVTQLKGIITESPLVAFKADNLPIISNIVDVVFAVALMTTCITAAITYVERYLSFGLYLLLGPIAVSFGSSDTTKDVSKQWFMGIVSQFLTCFVTLLVWRMFLARLFYGWSFFGLAVCLGLLTIVKNSEKIINMLGLRTMANGDAANAFMRAAHETQRQLVMGAQAIAHRNNVNQAARQQYQSEYGKATTAAERQLAAEKYRDATRNFSNGWKGKDPSKVDTSMWGSNGEQTSMSKNIKRATDKFKDNINKFASDAPSAEQRQKDFATNYRMAKKQLISDLNSMGLDKQAQSNILNDIKNSGYGENSFGNGSLNYFHGSAQYRANMQSDQRIKDINNQAVTDLSSAKNLNDCQKALMTRESSLQSLGYQRDEIGTLDSYINSAYGENATQKCNEIANHIDDLAGQALNTKSASRDNIYAMQDNLQEQIFGTNYDNGRTAVASSVVTSDAIDTLGAKGVTLELPDGQGNSVARDATYNFNEMISGQNNQGTMSADDLNCTFNMKESQFTLGGGAAAVLETDSDKYTGIISTIRYADGSEQQCVLLPDDAVFNDGSTITPTLEGCEYAEYRADARKAVNIGGGYRAIPITLLEDEDGDMERVYADDESLKGITKISEHDGFHFSSKTMNEVEEENE